MVNIRRLCWLLFWVAMMVGCSNQSAPMLDNPQPSPPSDSSNGSVLGTIELSLSSEPSQQSLVTSLGNQALVDESKLKFSVPSASVDTFEIEGKQYRYLSATVRITNNTGDDLSNLTLFAVTSDAAIGGTSIKRMLNSDGKTLQVDSTARDVRLVHRVNDSGGKPKIDPLNADYQAFFPEEVRGAKSIQKELDDANLRVIALQEGFTARYGEKSRTIPSGKTGTVAITVRFPLNISDTSQSPYSFNLEFAVATMDITRFTRGHFDDTSAQLDERVKAFYAPNNPPRRGIETLVIGNDEDWPSVRRARRVKIFEHFWGQDKIAPTVVISDPNFEYEEMESDRVRGYVEDNRDVEDIKISYKLTRLDKDMNPLNVMTLRNDIEGKVNDRGSFSDSIFIPKFPDKQGVMLLEVMATDKAGNVGKASRKVVILDWQMTDYKYLRDEIAAAPGLSLTVKDGKLYGWGRNNSCILGKGHPINAEVSIPSKIKTFEDSFVHVAVSENQAYAIKGNDQRNWQLYAWGDVAYLGLKDDLCEPTAVPGPIGIRKIAKVVAGDNHFLALDHGGVVWSWAQQPYHRLLGRKSGLPAAEHGLPTPITMSVPIFNIFAGGEQSLVLAGQNYPTHVKYGVWGWGPSSYGSISGSNFLEYPVHASAWGEPDFGKTAMIGVGNHHSIVRLSTVMYPRVANQGQMPMIAKLAGRNSYGQLGIKKEEGFSLNARSWIATVIRAQNIVVAAGPNRTFYGHGIIEPTHDGTKKPAALFATGNNAHGALGIGQTSEDRVYSFTRVKALDGIEIKRIATGPQHTLIQAVNGDIYAMGSAQYGVLGNGQTSGIVYEPQLISFDGKPPPVQKQTLSVSISGNGRVTSSPAGIDCNNGQGTCNYSFAKGISIVLSQSAASGYTFSGWSGSCGGTGSCQITMDGNKTVSATFSSQGNPNPTERYTLNVSVNGPGSVSSSPSGIDCRENNSGTCSFTFDKGTSVSLSQQSSAQFDGWSGDCNGRSCSVTMTANRSVAANFSRSGNPTPTDFTITFVPDNNRCNQGFTATTCSYKPQDSVELIGMKLTDAFPLAPIKVANLQRGSVTLSFDVTAENGGDTSKIAFNLDSELTPSKNIAQFTVNAQKAPSGTYIVTIKATNDGVTKELVYKFSPNL